MAPLQSLPALTHQTGSAWPPCSPSLHLHIKQVLHGPPAVPGVVSLSPLYLSLRHVKPPEELHVIHAEVIQDNICEQVPVESP